MQIFAFFVTSYDSTFFILNTCVTHRVKAVHKNMDCDMTLTLSEPICYILLPPGLLMFRLHVIQTQPKDGCTKSSIVSKEVRVITLKNVFSNVTLQITKTNLSVINLSY